VPNRLHELILDRHRRRFERRLARPVKDEAATGTGEQAEDDRMVIHQVLAENRAGRAIQLEHHGVEREHVLGRGLGRARTGAPADRRHVGGQILGARGAGEAHKRDRQQGDVVALARQDRRHDSLPLIK